VDLVLEKVNDFYRVKLVYGDKSEDILLYKKPKYEHSILPKTVKDFKFSSNNYIPNGTCSKFPEEALPTLKMIIQHYQDYGKYSDGELKPIPDKIEVVERFIINRPTIEPPPDLTGLDTLHELTPILIEAENNEDHYAINKVLDKMETLQLNSGKSLHPSRCA
jgi:hypothetical protein